MAERTLSTEEQSLARVAAEKLARGESLKDRERRAHTKAVAIQEVRWRQKIYRGVPQKDFGAMCGGQGKPKTTRQLQEMQRQWNLPFAGESVDLFAFLSALWVFLVEKGPTFRLLMESDQESEIPLGVELVKARIAKTWQDARAGELRNAEKEGRLLDRDDVHGLLMSLADRLRKASDAAQKRWGTEGFDFFNDLWSDFDAELAKLDAASEIDDGARSEIVSAGSSTEAVSQSA